MQFQHTGDQNDTSHHTDNQNDTCKKQQHPPLSVGPKAEDGPHNSRPNTVCMVGHSQRTDRNRKATRVASQTFACVPIAGITTPRTKAGWRCKGSQISLQSFDHKAEGHLQLSSSTTAGFCEASKASPPLWGPGMQCACHS